MISHLDKMRYVLGIYYKMPDFPNQYDFLYEIYKNVEHDMFENKDIFLYIDKKKWSTAGKTILKELFKKNIEDKLIIKENDKYYISRD